MKNSPTILPEEFLILPGALMFLLAIILGLVDMAA